MHVRRATAAVCLGHSGVTARRGILRRASAFNVFVALLGGFLLYLSLPNAGPVLRAARAGDGVQGIFLAQRLSCVRHPGHTACDWEGEFRSDDGTVTHRHVFLYGGADQLAVGARAPARDIGRTGRVYRHAGTREWVFTAFVALAGVLLLLKAGLSLKARTPTLRSPATTPADAAAQKPQNLRQA